MKIHQRYVSSAVLVALLSISASSYAQTAATGPAEFAANLLKNHAVLLTPAERTALDEINRELREAGGQLKTAEDSVTQEQAANKQSAATKRLVELLEKCLAVHRIAVAGNKVSAALAGPFTLPSDEGGILFRLENGKGGVNFFSQELDEARTEHLGAVEIARLNPGVTWVLTGFYHLPVGRTGYAVQIGRDGQNPIHAVMTIVTPPLGHVKVTPLDDDNGMPTPVMIRITSKTTGRDRPPSNAVDLGPQFEGNGQPTGHRSSSQFARLGGEWWVVPTPFDLSLPPDDYEIAVRRGTEHLPIFDQFTVIEGGKIEKTYRLRRWTDMRKLGWYSGDCHVHSRLMSDDDAARLMAWIRAEDVHMACVLKYGDIYRTYLEQRGWGKDYRVVQGDYVISSGQEDPRTNEIGHTISLNITNMVRDTSKYYLYDWVADAVHAQGGLFGYAHVAGEWFDPDRGMSIDIPREKIDFAEVMQVSSIGTRLWYDFLNAGFKLTATAGSDVPWQGTVGEVRTYAYLGDHPFSADAWFDAVRHGRTFVTNGPMVEFHVDDALPGDEIQADDRGRVLHVKARAWGHPDRNVPTKLTILKHGEVLREVTASNPSARELLLDFTVTADDGFWITARVDADDGSSAHTTPIYVTRPGLRFWKYDQVSELLDKRLSSLAEIEKIVERVLEKKPPNESEDDLSWKQLSPEERIEWEKAALIDPGILNMKIELSDAATLIKQQAPELLKRVNEAKQIYENLRQVAKREGSLRQAK